MKVMIDMEFLDTRSSAAILSIGAVFFDSVTGKLGNTFYSVVSADDCVRRHGMTISADTVKWWVDQDIKAINEAFKVDSVMMLDLAIAKLSNFLTTVTKDKLVVYSCGSLDLEILKFAYGKLGFSVPWDYYNERDHRTLRTLFPNISVPKVGTHHHALDDAKYQANLQMAIDKHLAELTSGKAKKVTPVVTTSDEEL